MAKQKPPIQPNEEQAIILADIEMLDSVHTAQPILSREPWLYKVSAPAGGGKTTLLKLIAEFMASRGSEERKGLYLAFNNQIVTEAEKKFAPFGVIAKTAHGMAWVETNMRSHVHRLKQKLSPDEILAGGGVPTSNNETYARKSERARLVWAVVEKFCSSIDQEIGHTHAGLPADGDNDPVPDWRVSAARCLWLGMTEGDKIPLTHSVYLKQWQLSSRLIEGFDYILFDEAQDAYPAMLDIVLRQDLPVVFVGDENQQIYSYTGAVNAMRKISAQEGRLTKSFRFGPRIAAVANHILAAKPEGFVPEWRLIGAGNQNDSVRSPRGTPWTPPGHEISPRLEFTGSGKVVSSRAELPTGETIDVFYFGGKIVGLTVEGGASEAGRPAAWWNSNLGWRFVSGPQNGLENVLEDLGGATDANKAEIKRLVGLAPGLLPLNNPIAQAQLAGHAPEVQEAALGQVKGKKKAGRADVPVKAILTRTNAGMMEAAFKVSSMMSASDDRKIWLMGGANDLINLMLNVCWLRSPNLTEARPAVGHPLVSKFKTWESLKRYAEAAEDMEILSAMAFVARTGVGNVRSGIAKLWPRLARSEKQAAIVLSTAHGAKGREWDEVILWNDFPVPGLDSEKWMKMTVEQREEEINLLHVAATRAMSNLMVNDAVLACEPGVCDLEITVQRGRGNHHGGHRGDHAMESDGYEHEDPRPFAPRRLATGSRSVLGRLSGMMEVEV